jgi:hypothetical protein
LVCAGPCVLLFAWDGPSSPLWIELDERMRFVILDNVKGETVTIAIFSSTDQFDNFVPRAEKILNSVE